jgi:ABC-type Mn2+/Zn2+ transport system ATPase subunit
MGQALLFDSGQLDRPMSSLSGGEQARVLIARVMLPQPATFCCSTNDERSGYSDAGSAKTLIDFAGR